MRQEKQIHWLLSELPELQRSGILSPETAQKLETHYKAELDAASGKMQTLFIRGILLIGVLLIACGVILLTAYNWDMLPRAVKTSVTFVPFLLASAFGILTLAKGWGRICREASALLISAGITTLISLVSQIYHLDGSMFDFLTLLLALVLPLIYIFESVTLAVIYALFLFSFSASGHDSNSWLPFAYAMLWLPFAGWILKSSSSDLAKNAVRGAVLVVAAGLPIPLNHHQIPFYLASAAPFFLLSGFMTRKKSKAFFSNLWFYAGYLVMTIWLLRYSGEKITASSFQKLHTPYFWVLWGIFIAGTVFCMTRNREKKLFVFTVFPLLAFLLLFDSPFISLAFMGYLLLAAAVLIDMGIRKKELLLINLGLFQILLLVITKFFDSFYGILTRAIVFITMGILLIAANWGISRFFKKGGQKNEQN